MTPMHDPFGGIDELSMEHVLEHYRRPRNKRRLDPCSFRHQGANPSCGDEVTFAVAFDADGNASDAAFEGHGCAISQAAASLLTDRVRGLDAAGMAALSESDVHELFGFTVVATRIGCATLALRALKKGLQEYLLTS